METFDALPWLRAVIIGALALGAAAILLNKERDVHRRPRARAALLAIVLVAVLAVAAAGAAVLEAGTPAPPERALVAAGLALSFGGALLDKSTKAARTWIGLGVAMMFAFSILLLEAPRPLKVSHLVRSVPVAGMLGGIVGAVLRTAAGAVLKIARRAPSRA